MKKKKIIFYLCIAWIINILIKRKEYIFDLVCFAVFCVVFAFLCVCLFVCLVSPAILSALCVSLLYIIVLYAICVRFHCHLALHFVYFCLFTTLRIFLLHFVHLVCALCMLTVCHKNRQKSHGNERKKEFCGLKGICVAELEENEQKMCLEM